MTQTRSYARRGTSALLAVVGVVALLASGCLVSQAPVLLLEGARAYDVNNQGLVVGSRWLIGPPVSIEDHAYSYDITTDTITDLGSLGGPAAARGVNDAGTIVGYARLASGQQRGFVYTTATGMVGLGTLTPAATTPASFADDVNGAGAIVGWSNLETGATDASHAFVRDPVTGTMTDLGTLGGTDSAAVAINDAGIVVGWSEIAGDAARHAFVYDPATDEMTDLGTLGGGDSEAVDLNEQGQVVGWSELPGDVDPICGGTCPPVRGFVHDLATGVTTQLGIMLGHHFAYPTGINEDGVVVGSTIVFEVVCSHCSPTSQATAWELGTTGVYAIDDPDHHHPAAINDAGLVAGTGFTIEPFVAIPFAYRGQVTHVAG